MAKIHFQMGPLCVFSEAKTWTCMTQAEKLGPTLVLSVYLLLSNLKRHLQILK